MAPRARTISVAPVWTGLSRFLDPEATTSSAVMAALVAFLLVTCSALTYVAGGAERLSQMVYLAPILLSALRFRHLATLATAVAAALLAGPLMPADLVTGRSQLPSEWLSRGLTFVAVGQLAVFLFRTHRAMSSALQSTQRMASQMQDRVREAEAQARRRDEVAAQVGQALRGTGIRILFQPIADLRTGTVTGVEALARFDLPPPRRPDTWFSHAWEVGLGPELEVLALRQALSAVDRLPESVYLSANVTAHPPVAGVRGAHRGPPVRPAGSGDHRAHQGRGLRFPS